MLSKKKIKKEIIKIKSLEDLKRAMNNERLNINIENKEKFKYQLKELFNLDVFFLDEIYDYLRGNEITYRSKSIKEFLDYLEKIQVFEELNKRLAEKLNNIKFLIIDRIEYESDDKERVKIYKEDLSPVSRVVENIKEKISFKMSEEERRNLENLEKELGKDIIFSKDIEIIKKMILINKNIIKEAYDINTRIRRIEVKLPKEINLNYIKVQKGSIEYYQHINSNIPRLNRLIKNLDKHIEVLNEKEGIFKINQSSLVQDTVNLAFATFNNKEFKAISGKNEVEGYCRSPKEEERAFKSYNVNKLGELGVGYNRVNDSEKKILEEINKNIDEKILEDKGELTLYTKWEPCPSCYYVINEFLEEHPRVNIRVKYNDKYC